jgi:hypothetical protein
MEATEYLEVSDCQLKWLVGNQSLKLSDLLDDMPLLDYFANAGLGTQSLQE